MGGLKNGLVVPLAAVFILDLALLSWTAWGGLAAGQPPDWCRAALTVLLAPFLEEFTYRGLLIGFATFAARNLMCGERKAWTGKFNGFDWKVIAGMGVLQAILFCALHDFRRYAFFHGLVYAAIYLYTRSLLSAATGHAAHNALVVVLTSQ